ncbi:hypothetical protein [Leuconostoc pseudomesenteroides]|uniref:hypothetical protein n=1 Tax=Leuconostoc pseudomesenteroides TaxID=33968 RepID=UPI00111F7964|nr:hypothetical protein [Leuconostoc pseudomesenteroides]TOZ00415.1 hypothetical protein DIS14_11600 [Leuconostoc pseudomesenteroides]
MADDIMAIERTRLCLVNGSRNMSLMLDKLRLVNANEMDNIRNIVKNIDVESGAIENEKALRLIEEIRDVDVFGFGRLQELTEHCKLLKNLSW